MKMESAMALRAAGVEPLEGISVLVDPHTASVWRKKWHYSGQRVFKPWHCDNLVRMMKQGMFRPKTQIAFVKVGDHYYLTNGQHTLAAIELSGTSQELSVAINRATTLEEVADDFARHDTHLTRQFGDSLVAHGVHEEFGIPVSTLHKVTAAVIYFCQLTGEVSERSAAMMTHDVKLKLVRKHGVLGVRSIGYFEGSTNRSYLVRSTTLASAMLCGLAHDAAEEFWIGVARDDGLRQGDPRKTLLEWLRERRTMGGSSGRGNEGGTKKSATNHELVKGIACAWNAYIGGRDLKLIKVNFDAQTVRFDAVGEFHVRGKRG